MNINYIFDNKTIKFCVDTSCIMFLIDRKYLRKINLNVNVKRTQCSIRIHNIDNKLHNSFEYIKLNFYIVDKLFNEFAIKTHFRHEIYLIDDFRAKVLLKINILEFEQIILDMSKHNMIFSICNNLITIVDFILKSRRIIRAIKSFNQIIISFYFSLIMLIKIREINLSND